MGVCPGEAPIAIDPVCLLRVKVVPSEEDSASFGVFVDLFQSVTAIRSVRYAFSVEITTQTAFKNGDDCKDKILSHRLRLR